MRIRSYKGPSLEKLYAAVQEELGPDAIVVSARTRQGLGGILSRRKHELIAVVDDSAADARLLSRAAASEDIERLSVEQSDRWKTVECAINDMRREIRTGNSVLFGADGGSIPEFAANWDPRFIRKAKRVAPEIFQCDTGQPGTECFSSLINVEETFPVHACRHRPRVVVLVGPTGSGKTTTFAKLAATWRVERRLNVGLITADTYRVAAVDQAREYASLLGMDLRVVFSAGEAGRAVEYFRDRDVILVDTPGRNHFDEVSLLGLQGILRSMGPMNVMLLIPATTGRPVVRDMIRCYKSLSPDYLVLTKIDETRDISAVTVMASETDCPLAFVTDGQNVPRDIRPARLAEIAGRLIGINPAADGGKHESDGVAESSCENA